MYEMEIKTKKNLKKQNIYCSIRRKSPRCTGGLGEHTRFNAIAERNGSGKAVAGGTPRAKGAAQPQVRTSRGKSCPRVPSDPLVPIARGPPAVSHPGGPREGKRCAPTYPAGRRKELQGPGRSANSPPSSARPAWWGAQPYAGAAPPACQHSPDTPRSAPATGPAIPGWGFPAPAARPLPGRPVPLLPPCRRAGETPPDPPLRLRIRCPGRALRVPPAPGPPGAAGREDAGLPSAELSRLPGAAPAVPSCGETAGEVSAATAPGGSSGGSCFPGLASLGLPAAGAARGGERAAAPWTAPKQSAPTCGEAPVRLLPRHISWS